MLTQVDSETLHQLSDVLQMPPEGMPPQMSSLLIETITGVLTEREKTTSSDSDMQTKRRPRVSRLLRWAFRRDSESEQSPDAENGINASPEIPDKRNTEEPSGAGSDS